MNKRGFASSTAAVALLIARAAAAQPQYTAQPESPQWLKDRRYTEGVGIRAGDLEVHPGIAGEFGYDSNYFLRTDKQNASNGPPTAPIIPSLQFRVTPSLYLATMSAQRHEGDTLHLPPSIAFRAGINATYRELIGISSDPISSNDNNNISRQRNVGGAADARLEIEPERPVGGVLFANFARVIQPSTTSADPNLAFNRDSVGGGGELAFQPGGGTLDWRVGYQTTYTIFEHDQGLGFNNLVQEASTRGRWRFRPRTALVYDATLRFINYEHPTEARASGLVASTPIRARLGMNGLITERFAALALVGYGGSFYDNSVGNPPQFDSVIAQAELKWFLAANPGVSNASDLSLSLSSLSLGYSRDFANSYLGNYYAMDRGYLKFYYFFAGRALMTLEGGLAAIEYPVIVNVDPGQPGIRHSAFTDARADATLYTEYRFTDAFGINTTLRYSQNFSKTLIPSAGASEATCGIAGSCFAMSWQRFEAYLGLRWFM